MKLKILPLLLLLFAFTASANAATVQGSAFEWFSFEKLSNVIIDINSTPIQRIVAKNGDYSLQLQKGDYLLRAEYFEGNDLKYETDENISITTDGNFTLDLIMFPAGDTDLRELLDQELDANIEFPTETQGQEPNAGQKPITESFNLLIAMAIIVLLLIIVLAFSFQLELGKRIKKISEKAESTKIETPKIAEKEKPQTQEKLDKYAQEVLQALRNSGNRLTQKELREKVQSIGEAKISLIVSELEAMGKIKKIKRGRGNIIILKEP